MGLKSLAMVAAFALLSTSAHALTISYSGSTTTSETIYAPHAMRGPVLVTLSLFDGGGSQGEVGYWEYYQYDEYEEYDGELIYLGSDDFDFFQGTGFTGPGQLSLSIAAGTSSGQFSYGTTLRKFSQTFYPRAIVYAGDAPTRYEVTFQGAVPEPASWAIMIGGLSLTGAALRARRARTLVQKPGT